jgi:hypothetical protein
MKPWSLAVLALVLGGNAWAHDGPQDTRAHTHWWLELGMEPSWYAGVAIGRNTFDGLPAFVDDGGLTSSSNDDSDIGFRYFAGVGLWRHLAFEIGYADFGEADFRGQSDGSGPRMSPGPVREGIAVDGYDLAVIGKLPVTDTWALSARVARLKWESTYAISGTFDGFGPFSDRVPGDGYDTTYGAGVEYNGLAPLRVALEYGEATFSLPLGQEQKADLTSIGLSLAYVF